MYQKFLSYPACAQWLVLILMLGASPACSGSKSQGEWDAIDYSSVYRRASQRENDSSYKPTSDLGCLDDDLYNCR